MVKPFIARAHAFARRVDYAISSWTNTAITFGGYTGSYGQPTWVVASGDKMEIQI